MLNKIAIVLLIIFLIFFLSNDKKMNKYTEKKNFKYLFIIFIFFCIYNDINILFVILVTLGFLYYNSNLYEKLKNNKILGLTIEKFANEYDFVPYSKENNDDDNNHDSIENHNKKEETKIDENINNDNKKEVVEPFKLSVQEIKEMYDNIKLQLDKMDE